jgi:hypothetical protein
VPDADKALGSLLFQLDADEGGAEFSLFLQGWRNEKESFYEALDRTAGTKDSLFYYDAMLHDFTDRFAKGSKGKALKQSLVTAQDALHDSFLALRQYRGFREAVAWTLVIPPSSPLPHRLQRYEAKAEGAYYGRGFISSANERVTAFTTARPMFTADEIRNLSPDEAFARISAMPRVEPDILPSNIPFADDARQAAAGLGDLSSIPGRGLGVLGDFAGAAGGVSAIRDAVSGQFNANDAANSFFGIEAGKSLGESAIGGLKSAATSLGEQLSGGAAAAGNVLNSVQGAGGKVITSLSQTAEQGVNAARGALTGAQDLVGGAVRTGTETAGAALDLAKGAASDVAEGVTEASTAVIPIVGEVAGIGLAGYQIYEGFKDLFTHPTAPTPIAVPTVANISQGFQSGV